MSTLDWIIFGAVWSIPGILLFVKAWRDGKRYDNRPDQDPWGMM